MARTPTWKRWTILFCGLIENLVFSGSILGWSALNYMLKQEGIFESVCYDDEISTRRTSLSLNSANDIHPSIEFDIPSNPYSSSFNYSIHTPGVTHINATGFDEVLNSTFDYMVTDAVATASFLFFSRFYIFYSILFYFSPFRSSFHLHLVIDEF